MYGIIRLFKFFKKAGNYQVLGKLSRIVAIYAYAALGMETGSSRYKTSVLTIIQKTNSLAWC